MLDFPNSPSVGQTFVSGNNQQWTWDGTKWLPAGSAAAYWPPPMNDNRLDNGDHWIDQHNAGASVALVAATGSVCPDRWWSVVSKAHVSVGQNYNGLPACPGFQYFLGAQITSAWGTVAATDYYQMWQNIEADRIGDLMMGTANAQTFTLSFWVCSSLTGAFTGAILSPLTPYRCYCFQYSIATANTWTKIVLTISGDTTTPGSWVTKGNGAGLSVYFDLGCGANFRTATANAWVNGGTGGFSGVTGSVNLISTLNAKWAVTGVKLEIGTIATPFVRQSLAKSLADCQRYYQLLGGTSGIYSYGYNAASTNFMCSYTFPQMRAAPTITTVGGVTYSNCSGINQQAITINSFNTYATVTSAGSAYTYASFGLSAEI